jgi:hypothetical protein
MEMRTLAGCEEQLVDNETTMDSGANRAASLADFWEGLRVENRPGLRNPF